MSGRRRARVVLAVLVLLSLVLVTVDFRSEDGPVDGLRGIAAAVLGPLQRAATSAVAPVADGVARLGDLTATVEENQRLREQVTALRATRRGTQELERRAAELEALLGLRQELAEDAVAARTVAVSPSNFEWTATVDVGTQDGVAEDMPVVNGDGLVGRVVLADRSSSVVLLAVDPNFAAAARLAGSGETGRVLGRGADLLLVELVDPGTEPTVGEQLVTSSYDFGVFPAGIPVGVVEAVDGARSALTSEVEVRPYVDFTTLGDVLVLRTEQVDPPPEVPDTPARDLDPPRLVPEDGGGAGQDGGGGGG